jgi:hypothetical protein
LRVKFPRFEAKLLWLFRLAFEEAVSMLPLWLALVLMGSWQQSRNIALHCPYTLQPAPNYRYCTDPDDRIQLTDGNYTQGYFWTQKSTVGWQNVSPIFIVVDLKRNVPIAGASFNTAAGVAGVEFPAAIWVLVSEDGKRWREVGDLVKASNEQNGPPPSQGYAVHRFWTDRWQTFGRFVAFVIIPQGSFCFVDEIEVYEGDASRATQPLVSEEVTDLKVFAQKKEIERCALRRFRSDLETLKQLIKRASLDEAKRSALKSRLDELAAGFPKDFRVSDPASFQTILPLNEWHAQLFKVQAQLWRAKRVPNFTAFVASSPYDPIPYLTDEPVPKSLQRRTKLLLPGLILLRNETRAIAINIVNARDHPITIQVKVTGLPDNIAVKIYHAVWTDTKEGIPIAAALLEGERFTVPAGMVGQAWLSVKATKRALKGEYEGKILVASDAGDRATFATKIVVVPLTLPDRPSLHVGGWDYTDVEERYGVNPKNRDAFIAHLRERFVDIPWASRFVLPAGKFDESGRMVEPPDTSAFDRWLERWKGASRFYVFVNAGETFEGSKAGTPEFERKVGEWISFWWRHTQKRGLKKGQFGVLLVDEPHTPEQDALTIAWAKAIKKAAPDVVIWVDPTWSEPQKMNPQLPELVDVLCPQRAIWLRNPKAHEEFYLGWRDKGKRLALYSCSGPSKLLDPYAYYRLQAWHCFAIGADEMFFWAFGDNGGNSCWNAYLDPRNCYTPLFLAPDSVTAAKHMEAIRDGVQDYEILKMLQRFAKTEKGEQRAEAEKLLTEGLKKVLEPIGVNELSWHVDKDRTLADRLMEQAIRLMVAPPKGFNPFFPAFKELPIIH